MASVLTREWSSKMRARLFVHYAGDEIQPRTVDYLDPQKAIEEIFEEDCMLVVDGFQFTEEITLRAKSPMYYLDARVFVEVDGTDKIVMTRSGVVRPFNEDDVFLEDPFRVTMDRLAGKNQS